MNAPSYRATSFTNAWSFAACNDAQLGRGDDAARVNAIIG
jgi:hypothetical protein